MKRPLNSSSEFRLKIGLSPPRRVERPRLRPPLWLEGLEETVDVDEAAVVEVVVDGSESLFVVFHRTTSFSSP